MPSIRPYVCLLLFLSPILRAETVVRSQVLIAGKPAGEQVTTIADDGQLRVHYAFNDRGRGPDLQATYRLGVDDIPVEAGIKGVAYLKTAVDEHYVRSNGKSNWRSGGESGTATPPCPRSIWRFRGHPKKPRSWRARCCEPRTIR